MKKKNSKTELKYEYLVPINSLFSNDGYLSLWFSTERINCGVPSGSIFTGRVRLTPENASSVYLKNWIAI